MSFIYNQIFIIQTVTMQLHEKRHFLDKGTNGQLISISGLVVNRLESPYFGNLPVFGM